MFADFQYTETTKVTGGSIVGMMKFAGKFSKKARQANEPMTSTVLLKGNRMAHINRDSTEIIDLDRETITEIDQAKRQYSVLTFQQMKERMEKAARQTRQDKSDSQAEVNFKAKVRNTGAKRQIANLSTKESILTLSIEAKDKQSGQSGAMAFTNDMWMAPEIPGYAEVRDFERRFATKMGFLTGGALSALVAMQPSMGQGMGEMVKEMSKLQGVPVLQIVRVGSTANGEPLPAASEAPLPASKDDNNMPSAGEVAQESAASAITSKLGGLGGFGGFGRKKKQEPKPEQPTSAKAQPGTASVLIESETEMNGFSSTTIDGTRFDVPAGYKKVEQK
jgi:hypothetical protein